MTHCCIIHEGTGCGQGREKEGRGETLSVLQLWKLRVYFIGSALVMPFSVKQGTLLATLR